MKKNQKYSQDEMYLAIEMWNESGLSQYSFCKREQLSTSTFSYWIKKYRKEKDQLEPFQEDFVKTFISVEVSRAMESQALNTRLSDNYRIEITYPNGVRLSCPVNIDLQQIKTLIRS